MAALSGFATTANAATAQTNTALLNLQTVGTTLTSDAENAAVAGGLVLVAGPGTSLAAPATSQACYYRDRAEFDYSTFTMDQQNLQTAMSASVAQGSLPVNIQPDESALTAAEAKLSSYVPAGVPTPDQVNAAITVAQQAQTTLRNAINTATAQAPGLTSGAENRHAIAESSVPESSC